MPTATKRSGVGRSELIMLKSPIPLRWKVSRVLADKHSVALVSYTSSRDVQEKLDEVVGPENWQSEFYESTGVQYCRIGIRIDGEWIWKSDAGAASEFDKEKGKASDAFKRAAVQWGVNRLSYKLGEVVLPAKEHTDNKFYPVDKEGNYLYGDALNEVCNRLSKASDYEVEFSASLVKDAEKKRIVRSKRATINSKVKLA